MKPMWGKRHVWIILALAAIVAIAASFFVPTAEGENELWWSHIFGFSPVFGLIGCAVLVVVAKLLGRYWLERREDYYD